MELDSELLPHYKKIFFSDYDLHDLHDGLFEAREYHDWNDCRNWKNLQNLQNMQNIRSVFNHPLSNALYSCTSLTHIVFGYSFSQPLSNSLNNCISLSILVFGGNFNQPLDNALDNCTSLSILVFGFYFNQPLSNALDNCSSLTYIEFGSHFSQPLNNLLNNCQSLTHLCLGLWFEQKVDLPFNIRFLGLDCNNSYLIEQLPDTIEEINIGLYFNLKLMNLSSSIKKITFEHWSNYDEELNCLPSGLIVLKLPGTYDLQIKNIPIGLTKLICSKKYKYINDFACIEVETY